MLGPAAGSAGEQGLGPGPRFAPSGNIIRVGIHAKLAVEERSTASLKPYARNARRHSKTQIKQIAKSIETYGFINPVLIADNGEIIGGHGRVAAAKLLGLETVPTIRLSHLTETQRRA